MTHVSNASDTLKLCHLCCAPHALLRSVASLVVFVMLIETVASYNHRSCVCVSSCHTFRLHRLHLQTITRLPVHRSALFLYNRKIFTTINEMHKTDDGKLIANASRLGDYSKKALYARRNLCSLLQFELEVASKYLGHIKCVCVWVCACVRKAIHSYVCPEIPKRNKVTNSANETSAQQQK